MAAAAVSLCTRFHESYVVQKCGDQRETRSARWSVFSLHLSGCLKPSNHAEVSHFVKSKQRLRLSAGAKADLHVEVSTETVTVPDKLSKSQPVLVVESAFSRSDGSTLAWSRATSSARNGSVPGGFGGFGDVRWAELGSSFITSRRPSTALEAGRSKAKKGQTSGGRIERRPAPAGRPKPSNVGESQDRKTVRREGAGQGEQQQGRDEVDRQTQGTVGRDRGEEKELNSTWQELGLGDRRAGGKFLPGRGAPVKEATRVGGWGRDKSMQRVITSEEQRASRGGRRERVRSGVRVKVPPSEALVVKKKKKAWNADFDPDPRIRHPPEYYKYGPYGPYAWKGLVVGKPIKGTWSTNQVVYFSTLKDEADAEDRKMYNVTVDYTNAVATFDLNIGIQYFYVFARRRFGPRPDPWEDWTLVAQLALESGRDLGQQGEIFQKIGSKAQDVVTQCVAWGRPDLAYVKKPKFHMRLESQEDFLKELFNLLDPTKDGNHTDSFYATLCKLVNVDIETDPRTVRNGFEALDEEGKMECMKHVFNSHPVKILSSARYDRQRREQRGEDGSCDLPAEGETDDESNDLVDGEEVDDQADQDSDADGNLEGLTVIRGIEESNSDSIEQNGRPDDATSESRLPQKDNRRPGMRKKRLYSKPRLKSAVRPYSYSNIIEEIAEIRTYVSRKLSIVSVR